MLRNGADVNAQNQDNDTPMHLALNAQHTEVVYQLLRSGGNSRIEGQWNLKSKKIVNNSFNAYIFKKFQQKELYWLCNQCWPGRSSQSTNKLQCLQWKSSIDTLIQSFNQRSLKTFVNDLNSNLKLFL